MPFVVETMRVEDIDEVSAIERESFSLPWPASAYRRELRDNRLARYLVARHYPLGSGPPSEGSQIPVTRLSAGEKGRERRIFPFSFLNRSKEGHESGNNRPLAPIVGYGGLWMMVDEAHITTLAVRPSYRGRGIGELLLVGLIDAASEMGATWVTLEVRVSNLIAQRLYTKYGFKQAGIRRRYYSDNNEDGLIMWSEPIASASYQTQLRGLKDALQRKLEAGERPADAPAHRESEPGGE